MSSAGDAIQADFRNRLWVTFGARLKSGAQTAQGTATVVPARPYPALRVVTPGGQITTLALQLMACA